MANNFEHRLIVRCQAEANAVLPIGGDELEQQLAVVQVGAEERSAAVIPQV